MIRFHGSLDSALNKLKAGREAKAARTVTAPTLRGSNFAGGTTVTANSQVIFTQPSFYSPLHTPQNWQIPNKRREVYQWLRYWVQNEPKVAAAIDFYANFPMNGFETQCANTQVKRYFDNFNAKISMDYWCKLISREYHMLGDCFPFMEISCKECKGTSVTKDGKPCRHPGGTFSKMVVLNPDQIDVQENAFDSENPVITMLPNDDLKRVVWHRRPIELYNRIPVHIRQLVMSGKPIPLNNDCVSHLKHSPCPYDPYGSSIIRRLFKVLSYKDKLMTAQWIVAERLILPIRLIKVGTDERPAGEADIADLQNQLAQTVNDPNLTLVTHHAVDYDWIGANGKVLTLSNEFELINKEILQGLMLNEALLSGEMAGYQCQSLCTQVLTRTGFKNYDDVSDEDEIACFNKDTECLEYHKPLARFCKDFDGDLVHFQTDRIDIAVTPNHKMLYQPRGSDVWQTGYASQVADRAKFRKTVKWNGIQDYPQFIELCGEAVPIKDYLEIAAFYVTEGYVRKETKKNCKTFGEPVAACIYQTEQGKAWHEMLALADRSVIKLAHYSGSSYHGDEFVFSNKEMALHLAENFGTGSYEKKIPTWIKSLPVDLLEDFLRNMVKGDGHLRTRNGIEYRYGYDTVSDQLKDDVAEIALKCGYLPKIVQRTRSRDGISKKSWIIYFSDIDRRSNTLPLCSKKYKTITKMPYKGKVWCFTVPTGFFITQRNGRIAIQGNSAAIGAESLIRRMESWRLELSRWIEDRVYKPLAMMQGFINEEESKLLGEPVYDFPKIKWNDMNLRDDNQKKQLWIQLYDKQAISMSTLLEQFEIDYDHEIERMRYETAQQQFGQAQGGAAGGGGMDMGGGAAGGAPPMDMGGGAPGGMPGGDMGAAPGGMPGGDMGGAAPGGDMGGAAPAAGAAAGGGSMNKILTRGRATKAQKPLSEEAAEPVRHRLTSLEAKMYKTLMSMNIPFRGWVQYPLGKYRADFAYPQLKLAIECDGSQWHDLPDDQARDINRDQKLAQSGWTTLRFGEAEIKERMGEVQKTVATVIYKLWAKLADMAKEQEPKKAAETESMMVKMAGYEPDIEEVDDFEFVNLIRAGVPSVGWPYRFASNVIVGPWTEIEDSDGQTDQGQGNTLGGDLRGEVGLPQA